MNAHDAVAASRIHDQILPNKTCLEKSSPPHVNGHTEENAKALQARGHKVEWLPSESGRPLAMSAKLTSIRGHQYRVRCQVELRFRW